MLQINWPMAVVLVAVVMCGSALAATHVIAGDWIQHTMTGIIGYVLGTATGMGFRFGFKRPGSGNGAR